MLSCDVSDKKLRWLKSIRRIRTLVATYAPPFVLFMAPALINGFPLMFEGDSGGYLAHGILRDHAPVRPIYYSYFLFALHWCVTLWPPIAAQSAITVAVLAIFLRRNLAALAPLNLTLQLCALAGLTSLSVLASEIMPDIFTPLMILSLCVLIFRPSDIAWERIFLYAVTLAALCFHVSNFLIALLMLVFAVLFRLLVDRAWHQAIRRFTGPVSLLALAIGLLLLPTYLMYHQLAITRGSGIFLLAKLLDDGPGLDYLEAKCPVQNYSICSQLREIRHQKEMLASLQTQEATSDYFLWRGPLKAAGGWDGLAPYAGSIAVASILYEPGTFIQASLASFGRQLVRFDTGDNLGIHGPGSHIRSVLKDYFANNVSSAYLGSRQETGRLDWAIISRVHKVSVEIGLFVIVILLPGAFRADRALAGSICMLLVAVVANAAVTGTLSAVHDRYQSRVAGLIVVAAMVLAYARFSSAVKARVREPALAA